ncbi:MAG: flagellar motor protein MotB [Sphingobium sp.]
MTGAAPALARRGRWIISFADMCLLLLGFFVLLQASASHRQEVVEGVSRQFGAPMVQSDRLVAARLFQPGEAILTPAGALKLRDIARRHQAGGEKVELRSIGLDPATNRFDNWDLAAARVGAVARKLVEEGVARHRIVIRGLDQEQGGNLSGQTLVLTLRPAGAGE